jgi:hypothetical protein
MSFIKRNKRVRTVEKLKLISAHELNVREKLVRNRKVNTCGNVRIACSQDSDLFFVKHDNGLEAVYYDDELIQLSNEEEDDE